MRIQRAKGGRGAGFEGGWDLSQNESKFLVSVGWQSCSQ